MATRSRVAHPRPWAIRWVSLFYLLCPVCVLLTAGSLGVGLLLESEFWLGITLASVATLAACLIAATVAGQVLRCSVCANPIFVVRRCRKHHRAKKFLGISHRLGIASAVLIAQQFHCMYCGEKIPLSKRVPKPPGPGSPILCGPPSEPAMVEAGGELPPPRS